MEPPDDRTFWTSKGDDRMRLKEEIAELRGFVEWVAAQWDGGNEDEDLGDDGTDAAYNVTQGVVGGARELLAKIIKRL